MSDFEDAGPDAAAAYRCRLADRGGDTPGSAGDGALDALQEPGADRIYPAADRAGGRSAACRCKPRATSA
ncbi:hypothetical protein M8494_03655 [Serratia ureilytica]